MTDPIEVPDGMVHVGWFCDHAPSQYDRVKRRWRRENPHREWRCKNGEYSVKKNHSVGGSLAFNRYQHRPQACPLAVPVFAHEGSESAANFIRGARSDG